MKILNAEENSQLEIKELIIPDYEKVVEAKDKHSGLHCLIAIHDTTLGPALGGARIYPYKKREDALEDVLRLAKGMTYKSALVEDGFGGGKSVIIANPKTDKSEALLEAFGKVIQSLQGAYIVAEDIGSSVEDMTIIRRITPYVAALPTESSSGDPSRFTAWGVFRGLQSIAMRLWKSPSLRNRRIAIQGVGHVGSLLADLLFWEGAELIFSDVDEGKVNSLAQQYGARIVKPENFLTTSCDILSPCALGGILNKKTIPYLKCQAIAGSANNQLLEKGDGRRIKDRGIVYAPDFVINAGGIINAAAEFERNGYDPKRSRDQVDKIYDTLLEIFVRSEVEDKTPNQIAIEIANQKLLHKVGRREQPIEFHD
jgi:leucine dehydrogenase